MTTPNTSPTTSTHTSPSTSTPSLSDLTSVTLDGENTAALPNSILIKLKNFIHNLLPTHNTSASLLLKMLGVAAGTGLSTFYAFKGAKFYYERYSQQLEAAKAIFLVTIVIGTEFSVLVVETAKPLGSKISSCFYPSTVGAETEQPRSTAATCVKVIKVSANLVLEMMAAAAGAVAGPFTSAALADEETAEFYTYLYTILGAVTGYTLTKALMNGASTLYQGVKAWCFWSQVEAAQAQTQQQDPERAPLKPVSASLSSPPTSSYQSCFSDFDLRLGDGQSRPWLSIDSNPEESSFSEVTLK